MWRRLAPAGPAFDEVKDEPLPERLRRLVASSMARRDESADEDGAGALLWHTLSRTLAYASKRLPEIADSPKEIDNAMKWGFGWEMGPFETWDALGVAATAARMQDEGLPVAAWVQEMLDSGYNTFYKYEEGVERSEKRENASRSSGEGGAARRLVYNPRGEYEPADGGERVVSPAALKRSRGALAENDSASLLDMGDGVLLLEFHTKMNALDTEIGAIADAAIERLHGDAAGLVIGNQGGNFSAGANLYLMGMLAQSRSVRPVGRGHQGSATDDAAAAPARPSRWWPRPINWPSAAARRYRWAPTGSSRTPSCTSARWRWASA